ncbi:MAG: anaerobic ribonucleoside-triphosphate reductase activating protein [Thermovenabulum sp.]|uniref:anaerobic ribonucleoside-triphosphate reductase activating protein n=1 Tax=Thermovenabulum sp. TaxID=3100335 RepID=UPI003C7C97BB
MAVIYDFLPVTLADYPGMVATTAFVAGCNFHCPYCHNAPLIKFLEPDGEREGKFFLHLENRKNKIDGVVLTGGEPTLNPGLKNLIEKIKTMGFKVKLDTNGSRPEVIKELLRENLLDYIAMDLKAPFEKYGIFTRNEEDILNIKISIEIIKKSGIPYEFRTTVHEKILNFRDFQKIAELLEGAECYVLQAYKFSKNVLDEEFCGKEPTSKEFLLKIKELMINRVKRLEIRF